MEKSKISIRMKTNTIQESLKYSSPVCEIFAYEAMTPLCVSGVEGSGASENFDESDYVWQVK